MEDIKFRLVRDKILSKGEYKKLMFKMFKQTKFSPKRFYDILFMSKQNIIKIKKLGHIVGLHSHTHPMAFEKLTYVEQLKQYTKNLDIVSNILKCKKSNIVSMSHPCGSYDGNTLNILENLGMKIGFRHSMLNANIKKINN